MDKPQTTPIENIYFVYDEIDDPTAGSCPECGGTAYVAEAAQAAHVVEQAGREPLDIPEGCAWCPSCQQAVTALPEEE